MIGITNAI